MIIDVLKEKLEKCEKIFATMHGEMNSTRLPVIYKGSGLDFIVMDLEHGAFNPEMIGDFLQICNIVELPVIIRVQDCEYHCISKPLDMGADGIMIPRTETMEQVETAIRCARYYPRGRKGCGGFSNLRAEDKGSVDNYNDNRLIFIQMESNEGLDILPQILENYGKELAGVLIGPYDASIMIGTPLDIMSDAMTDYIRKVFAVCTNYGIACGSFVDGPALFARYRDLGANVYWTGTDIGMLCTGFKMTCDAFQNEVK